MLTLPSVIASTNRMHRFVPSTLGNMGSRLRIIEVLADCKREYLALAEYTQHLAGLLAEFADLSGKPSPDLLQRLEVAIYGPDPAP
ncbi:hypothetical protein [Silvimonas soli]|uniref:hypothetical protein n=1 Tax=Silvimonas soli TaxID=2980100 RepID=UPI0024B3A6F6|nr:hypothetical protein [Silvimonas soli]